jgi:hypothetical protein
MSEKPDAEDPRVTAAAWSISRGMPVNWQDVAGGQPAPEKNEVLTELQALETLAQLSKPVPDRWGAFVITGEIGRGTFGVVYRAFDPNLQLELALKIVTRKPPSAFDPLRALSEARLLAQIDHPNVVRVYRAEQIGDEVGVAMELIKGTSLAALVRRQGPYSARETMLIVLDLCRALAAVHRANVLHGDIKAHNVMRAEGGRTVLMDFGSARDASGDLADDDAITGTPLYLAPEVFAGDPRTRSSDIYSLGVLLYFLATASYPIGGSTRSEVERRHSHAVPRKHLRDVRPDLPESFIRVVDRALAYRPEDRHESAGALEADLNRALALDAGDGAKPWRWRHLVIAAALLALVGAGAIIISQGGGLVPSPSAPTSDAAATAPAAGSAAAPTPAPADEYRIHAAVFRELDGRQERLDHGARLNPGDKLSLQLTATVPIYFYVVNEDEQGEAWLLFPLDAENGLAPLRPGQKHRLPVAHGIEQFSWEVSSRGGREHILLFASRERPSLDLEHMFAGLPRPVFGRPVDYQRLSPQAVQMLRGIGGLKANPSPREITARLTKEFAVPLTTVEETVRGVWVRRLTLENP